MRRGDGKREGWKKEDMETPHWFWLRRNHSHRRPSWGIPTVYSLTVQTRTRTHTHTHSSQIRLGPSSFSLLKYWPFHCHRPLTCHSDYLDLPNINTYTQGLYYINILTYNFSEAHTKFTVTIVFWV